jgi:endonuclease III
MKKMALYARRIKQLASKLRKERGKVSLPAAEDAMQQFLRGILSTYASETRADTALAKLRAAMVDLNELRVTPVADIVQIIGTDFPSCRPAAEELSRGLNAVFNKAHRVDLDFLKTMTHKAAETFVESLDGVGAHAKAMVMLRCLGTPVVPVDNFMLAYLHREGCIPETATAEDAQKFLSSRIPDREATAFYVGLKKHAASHAPRKPEKPVKAPAAKLQAAAPAVEAAAKRPAVKSEAKAAKPAKKPTAKSSSGKGAARKS